MIWRLWYHRTGLDSDTMFANAIVVGNAVYTKGSAVLCKTVNEVR